MIFQPLLANWLLAGSALAAAIPNEPPNYGPFFTEFPLSQLSNATNFGASSAQIGEITLPLSKDGGNLTDSHICIQDHHPFRQNCAKAIESWRSQAFRHNEIYVSKGTCKTATWGCCESVVCAPLYLERRMPVWELMTRYWQLLHDRCSGPEEKGVWRPEGVRSLYMLTRPANGSCEINMFGEER